MEKDLPCKKSSVRTFKPLKIKENRKKIISCVRIRLKTVSLSQFYDTTIELAAMLNGTQWDCCIFFCARPLS